MISVVFGITHPRLCEELPEGKHKFFDIGETKSSTLILKNLMKDLLDYDSHPDIDLVFSDFCKSRVLNNESNYHHIRLKNIFKEFSKWYNGTKVSATKMYLIKREGNKVLDVYERWNTYRENPFFVPKKAKPKKTFYV
jgi:hypothetical protein